MIFDFDPVGDSENKIKPCKTHMSSTKIKENKLEKNGNKGNQKGDKKRKNLINEKFRKIINLQTKFYGILWKYWHFAYTGA